MVQPEGKAPMTAFTPVSPGGVSGSADVDRVSVYSGGNGSKYIAIRLSNSSYEKTGFGVGSAVQLGISRDGFVIEKSSNGGRPFYFREETTGIIKLAVNKKIVDKKVDLERLMAKGPQEIECEACRRGYFEGKWPR